MNWELLLAVVSAVIAIVAAWEARKSNAAAQLIARDSQMPLLTFSRTCPPDQLNGVTLTVHNHGVGPALALEYFWQYQPMGASMGMSRVPDDQPGILIAASQQSIDFEADWLRIMYDEAKTTGQGDPRLIGTLTATYKDIHGRPYRTHAELRFVNPSNEIGMCDNTVIFDEEISLPNGVTAKAGPPPEGATQAFSQK